MFQVRGQIKGLPQVLRNLDQLGSTKARAISRRAMTSAASATLKESKRLVPKETGLLKKSLGKKTKTYRGSGTTYVGIGPRQGYRDPNTGRNPVNYAHLVENGTISARAKPFMRPALMNTEGIVIRNYQTRLWEGIYSETLKMRKS